MARSKADWSIERGRGYCVKGFRFSPQELIDVVSGYGLPVAQVLALQRPIETALLCAEDNRDMPQPTQQELLKVCDDLEKKAAELAAMLQNGGLGGAARWIEWELHLRGSDLMLAERLADDLRTLRQATRKAKPLIVEDVPRKDAREGDGFWRAILVKDLAEAFGKHTEIEPKPTYDPDRESIGLLAYVYVICLQRLECFVSEATIKADLLEGLKLLNK